MRRNIVHEGADKLKYEIREIVEIARHIDELGTPIHLENIGDPIAKGEIPAPWITRIVSELTLSASSYAYTHSQGDGETRQFLAERTNRRGGVQISAEDVIFFNGLGDAVAKLFGFLKREARVIGPTPAYSTHSSAEAAHSGYDHMTYALDPNNGWLPDLAELRNKVRYNDAIAGILLINPDNPTGIVYRDDLLREIVDIAKEFNLFIIADETYTDVVFPGVPWTPLSSVIDGVPSVSLRSISKSFPWPGARCGWIEVYNRDADPHFDTYIQSLVSAKRLEVCSTTLPQLAIPRVLGHPEYSAHVLRRTSLLKQRAEEAYALLSDIPGIQVAMPEGALYMTVVFKEGALNPTQKLDIDNPELRRFVDEKCVGVAHDKRFVYQLLGATGICVVPLTGFYSGLEGFRFTLLETDDERRAWIYRTLADAIRAYLG